MGVVSAPEIEFRAPLPVGDTDTPPHGHPALISTHEPILVATIPGLGETFKTVIDEMTHGTDFTLVNLLHSENANLTHEDLNTSIDEPETRWNIYLVSYDS